MKERISLFKKLKEIFKQNYQGLYISAICIFLGSILINIMNNARPFVSPFFLFGEGVLIFCTAGIGLLIGVEEDVN